MYRIFCSLLADTVWKAVTCFISPLVAQSVWGVHVKEMPVYPCEQEELLAAPRGCCPGGCSDGRRDGSSISACFNVLVKTSQPSACGRLRTHVGVVSASQAGKPTNKTTAPNHHQDVRTGSPFETPSDLFKYPQSNPGHPRLCLYRGTGCHCF